MAEEFKVAVKLHADASQYTAEFDRAGLTAQAFIAQLQGGGKQAAAGLQAVAAQAEKIGSTVSASGRVAATGLESTASAAQSVGAALRAAGAQGAEGLERVAQASKGVQSSQSQATAAGTLFLAGLREQITLSGKSADELLRYRAAQSGVAAEAAPLILQWKNQRAAQESAADAARKEEAAQREASAAKHRAAGAADSFMASLRDQVAVAGKSTEELIRYRAAQAGVASEAAPLITQLQNQRTAQQAAAEAARIEEAAQREAIAAKQRAQGAADSFIASLREQAAIQGKSAADVMRYRAAQLGVTDASEHYIQAIEKASGANGKAALSAGQHAQAMRMLPMQMTDVVTSVASGMPIWMVAIQQGGQVKDSFNGVGNAFKAVGSLVTPTVAGVGLLAGAAGLAAIAYNRGSAEADGFRNAIVMNGGVAGVTVSQMTDMAKAIGEVAGGQHAASGALTEMAGSGAVAGESLQKFTQLAMELEKYAGQPVKTTAEHMAQLGEAPVKASLKLNEQYHYLTDAVYQQIKALDAKGQKDEAAALAQKTYGDAMAERTGTLKSSLGTLERVWDSLGSTATKAWNAMLNVGRAATLTEIRAKVDETTRELNGLIATTGTTTEGGAYVDVGARQRARKIAALQKQLGDLNAQAAPLEAEDAQAQLKAQQQADEEVRLAARQRVDEMRKSVRARADIRKDEIKQLDIDRDTLGLSQKEYDKLVAGINEKYKDPKGSTAGQVNVTDTQLANLRSQLQAAKLYHQQLVTLGAGASELNAAERESLKLAEQVKLTTDAKTLAKLAEAKAAADALGVQLRSNEGLEKSYKAHQQLIDTTSKDADTILERARSQEAANTVFGKGRTAIEQMTLATLQHQMTEAQGTDRTDPKYIAALERKISAQKRFVDSLGQADYKAVAAHADELLRNAQELSKTYENELALSGLTGLEREKIVAQRAVELKYAKELAKLNQQSLTDDEKKAARKKIEEARDIETSAALAKAQQDHMGKASEEINRSLTDALLRGFESGKGFAENLGDTVKNMFSTMVLRPTISAVMTPISGVINGVVQQGLSAVGLGGGPNLAGMASNAASLYNMYSGGGLLGNAASTVGGWMGLGSSAAAPGAGLSVSSTGYGLSAGSTGLGLAPKAGAIGSNIGNSAAATYGGTGGGVTSGGASAGGAGTGAGGFAAGAAGVVGGYFAGKAISGGYSAWGDSGNRMVTTGTAIGAAVGSIFPVIGTAIGAVVGGAIGGAVNKVFGHKLKDTGIDGTFGGETGFEGQQFQFYKGGWLRSDKTEYSALDESMREAWGGQYLALREGTTAMAETLGLGADALTGFTSTVKLSLKGLSEDDAAKAIQAEFDKVAESMASAVLTTGEYSRADETRVQTLARLSTHLSAVNAVFETLNTTLYGSSLAGADMSSSLIDLFGGIDQFGAATSTYFKNFYSVEEQRAAALRSLQQKLGSVNLSLPDINAEDAVAQYRALADAQDLTTESGRNAWATLVQLSGAFAELTNSASAAAATAAATAKATATSAANAAAATAATLQQQRSNLISLETKFANGGYSAAYKAQDAVKNLQLAIGGNVIEEDVPALVKILRGATSEQVEAYFREVWGSLDTVEARKHLIEFANGALDVVATDTATRDAAHKAAIDTAWSELQRSVDAGRQIAGLAKQAATDLIGEIRGVVDVLRSNVRSLYGEVDSTAAMAASEGRAVIDSALASGIVPDQSELSGAIAAITGNMQRTMYASQFEADRERLVLAGELAVLQDSGEKQLTAAERQLNAAEAQLVYLDGVLASGQAQLDAINGVTGSVDGSALRVEEALSNLAAAILAQKAGQSAGGSGVPDSILKMVGDAWAAGDKLTAKKHVRDYGISNEQLQGAFNLNYADLRYLYSQGITDQNPGAYKFKSNTPEGIYKEAKSQGLSMSDVDQIIGAPSGTAAEWAKQNGLPAFADGGYHTGGWRMVGERGPELAFTGPEHIYSNSDTNRMLGQAAASGPALTEALQGLFLQMLNRLGKLESLLMAGNGTRQEFFEQFENLTDGGNEARVRVVNKKIIVGAA